MSNPALIVPVADRPRGLRKLDSRILSVGTLVAFAVLPMLGSGFWLYSVSLMLAYAIMILSISFMIRFSSEVSIGHNFFIAVGAYVVAVLQTTLGVPFLLGTCLSIVLSVMMGIAFAWPSRSLSGVYLSVVTLALGLCVPEILLYWSDLTGGFEGIFIDSTAVPGIDTEKQQYYVALIALSLAAFAVYRFRHSRIGLAILTARDHPHAAASFGMTTGTARISVFAVSAGIAGLGGAVLAFTTSMVSPNSFTFWNSVTLLVGSVVSLYSTRVYGALIGAAFITVLPQVLSNYGQIISIIYGLALLGVILTSNLLLPTILRHFRRRGDYNV